MRITEPSMTLWCCVDCLILEANGETPTEMSQKEVNQWLADIAAIQGDAEVTLGMVATDHSCTELRIQERLRTKKQSKARGGFLYQDVPSRFSFHSWRSPFRYLFTRYDIVCDNGHVASFYNEDKAIEFAQSNIGPTANDVGGECYCETKEFSHSSCDLCGSGLGGERHAFTFWFVVLETKPMTEPYYNGKYVCVAPGGCNMSPFITITHDGMWYRESAGGQFCSAHKECIDAHAARLNEGS